MSVMKLWFGFSSSKANFELLLQANDLEETIKRIQGHKGVVGMMIVNNDGKCNPKSSKKFGQDWISFELCHFVNFCNFVTLNLEIDFFSCSFFI